jgi:hypothetical protein
VEIGESNLIKGKKKHKRYKNNFIDKDEQTNTHTHTHTHTYIRGLFLIKIKIHLGKNVHH